MKGIGSNKNIMTEIICFRDKERINAIKDKYQEMYGKDLLAELSDLPMIEAVALGGSRAGENYDENSDYDIYLYCTQNIPEETRKKILES